MFRKASVLVVILTGWTLLGDNSLRHAYERVIYQIENAGPGCYAGLNPAQRLALKFSADEARLEHPQGHATLRLAGYGYGNRLRTPTKAAPSASENRVEYRRGEIREWYINESRGLEQGFTLARRPGASRSGEPLVVALHVSGGLRPELAPQGDGVLLRSNKGAVLRYAGLRATDARGRVMPSHLQVGGQEIFLIVEDRSAAYPLVVDPTWTQQQELTAADGATDDNFGISVALSGYTAIVGAWRATIGANKQGAAYVFVRGGSTWTLQQKLTASDGIANDNFGESVAISGDTAVVSAIGASAAQGAVYVFVRNGGVWTQQQKIITADGTPNDNFGSRVSISGDTLAAGTNTRGFCYVFVRNGTTWTQQQKLGAGTDAFGINVVVDRDTLIAGAQGFNQSQGAAYVFVRSGTTWTQQQILTPSNGAPNDNFGAAVALRGDTAVIGAGLKTIGINQSQGAAYIFVRSGTTWTQQQALTAADGAAGDAFGERVSLSGYRALIGAPLKRLGVNQHEGAVYVYVRGGVTWTLQQELTAPDGAAGDEFGSWLAANGTTLLAGAEFKTIGANGGQGAAYVITRPTIYNDFGNTGLSGGMLYTATIGQEYTAISNGNGTYQYVPNLFTSQFDTLRTGDFNGDGIADVIQYNSQTALAYIGFGNGDGTFNFGSLFWSPGYDIVETGDINGDGITDVALYNSTTGTLYTGISNANGTFTYQYHLVSMGCTFISLRDFTGDGKGDMLLYRASDGLASLGVGDGAGNLTFHALILSPGYALIDVGDLNADGKTDVLLYNPSNGNAATGIADGSGSFAFTPLLFTPGFTSVRLADFTGDGKADATLYNKNTALAYFGTGNGDGTFNFQSLFWSPGYDYVIPEDVSGDGKADMILYNSATGTQYTGISGGGGTFTYSYTYWGIGKILAR